MKKIIFILLTIFICDLSAKKVIIKMASLAPEGTVYHGMLIEMGQKWKKLRMEKLYYVFIQEVL